MVKMKFRALFFLILFFTGLSTYMVIPVEGASDSFVGGSQEFYIVKEVIEVTSDWQDIKWIQGPKVYATRHRVMEGADEGADAIKNLEVTGLTVWIVQKSLDTVKVVLEIEALVLKGDETAQVVIEKGAIGSANVKLTVYDASKGSFSEVSEFSTGKMYRDFEFNIAPIYVKSTGELVLEETLKDLKGKVLSFYYPWYTSPHGPSGRWDHWLDVTEDSIFDSTHYPLHGAYDSNDENVIRSHMAIAKQAGIDAFIVSWWGIKSYEEKPVDEILKLAEQMNLNITFYYESVRDLTKNEIVDELTYLFETYSDHPAFLRVSGMPVLFVYAIPAYNRDSEFWLDVRGLVEENVGPVVLIGDTDDGEYLHVFDGFHVYIHLGEDVPGFYRGCVDRFEVGVSPMDTDELFTVAYSGEDLDMRVKPFHSVLITSWNEWHEGTEMEPSREHAFDYIDMTRAFIEEYKGASIPEPEVAYSATAETFRQGADLKGAGEILISAEGAPALYVNVSVNGGAGVTSLILEGDFYSYVKRQGGDHASMIIPSVALGVAQEVEVVFEAEAPNPDFTVSITTMDPTGTAHELFYENVNSVAEGSITAFASSGSIEYGESITISGHLSPEIGGNEVDLEYTGPDSMTLTRTVTTSNDGSYSDLFAPPSVGTWKAEASWYGDEDFEGVTSQVVGFIVRKASASLSLQPSAPSVMVGETLTISGSIEPTIQGAEVGIEYTMPDGTTDRRTTVTDSDGVFSDSITPTDTGSWAVRASWEGDSTHIEAISEEVTLQVEEKRTPRIIPGFPHESILLGVVLAALMLLVIDSRVHVRSQLP
jgi:hypothetical protein